MQHYLHILFYAEFVEHSLQNFVVVQKLVVHLGLPVHFRHRHFARIDGVEDLAVDGSRPQFFNLANVQLSKQSATFSSSLTQVRIYERETK